MKKKLCVLLIEGSRDEIQMCEEVPNPDVPNGKGITFYDALNEFREIGNLDVYVTGSNSHMLSSDILTEFRGRSNEIRKIIVRNDIGRRGFDKNGVLNSYSEQSVKELT